MTRTVPPGDLMWPRLLRRVESQSSTLQGRVRDMLVQAVAEGLVLPGEALPSSRLLAKTLGVSRMTVTLALQGLAEKGLVVGRARSGCFVSAHLPVARLVTPPRVVPSAAPPAGRWRTRLRLLPSSQRNITKPVDWQQLAYPFIYGQFDATLFPFRDWRRCVLESLAAESVRRWAPDQIDRDDDGLVDQIQRRLLPARGIWAERDEILVTSGAQQATFLLAELLVGASTSVGMETPGYPDARNNFALRTRHVRMLRVDADGLVPGPALARCDYVYVTPSHQCPTTVTMSLARRQALLARAERDDFIVIEDDHESELNFSDHPTPALKSLDTAGRVLYVGSLSKTLAHGLRLGFVVAPAELVRELRALRRLMMRHVCTNNQRAAASFIAHGFQEAHVRRLNAAYRERARALRWALSAHAPGFDAVPAQGGSALWVRGPAGLDAGRLAAQLHGLGVVIEPGEVFYPAGKAPLNHLRMGYSSIPVAQIEAGVRLVAREAARQLAEGEAQRPARARRA
jgi:GntR family transcriptional regulator / MocR family aminotransferase